MSDHGPFDAWVQRHLTAMRAPAKRHRTIIPMFGRRLDRHRPLQESEAVLLGPNGQPIRVVERLDESADRYSGNQIEHGDHLHAVVRPKPINIKLGVH